MNRKRLSYVLTGVGLVLALFVGVVVYSQVADAERVKASLPTARVVIATEDIPIRTEIAASMINVRTVPDDLVQAASATRVEDVVGKFSPDAIPKGAIIDTQRIGSIGAKNAPSFRIEKGKVMYVMPVSFAGTQFSIVQVNALRPGDRVDLLYTTINSPQDMTSVQRDAVQSNPIPYLQTRVMLQDLRIQEIGAYAADGSLVSATGDPSAKGVAPSLASASIIFIVEPEQALVLKWLRDAAIFYKGSNIEMVLRSPADEAQMDTNLVINFNYMREKYNLAPPPSNLAAAPR